MVEMYGWQDILLTKLCKKPIEAPNSFNKSYEYVKGNLTSREAQYLDYRFKYGVPLQIICQRWLISETYALGLERRILRTLRLKSNLDTLMFGLDYAQKNMVKTPKLESDIPVEDLNLPTRFYNWFKRNGINTAQQLIDYSYTFITLLVFKFFS
jgi:hypothetical protein